MKIKLRRLGLVIWLLLWPLLAISLWTPISFGALRLGIVLTVFALWAGALTLFWKSRAVRVAGVLSGLLVLGLGVFPARRADPEQLRLVYTDHLVRYGNTPYVWGGENGRGIDCSGLMRRALIDANLSVGWKTRDPALWREALALWWHDCSAREMQNGYGGKIRRRFAARSLNALDYKLLQPGDMAVMQSGVHVLAHLGNRNWIQADPNLSNGGDKVIETSAPSKNGWFGLPVVIVRWKQLDGFASAR